MTKQDEQRMKYSNRRIQAANAFGREMRERASRERDARWPSPTKALADRLIAEFESSKETP